ncbi:hypothetical protein ACFVP3_33060 [Streptomyces sp. NPDC057806]|uniref:hypothetical protein n=1 Tax=Streptomyces sp. NPDC057806 TaxID=3346255 RepID=UPI00367A085A
MSDQHAAAAVTAAAAIALALATWAAFLHGSRRRSPDASRPGRRGPRHPSEAASPPVTAPRDAAEVAVREAELHIQRCWQRLRAHSDPPQ